MVAPPPDRPLHHPRPGIYNAVLRSADSIGHRLGTRVDKMRLRAEPDKSQIIGRIPFFSQDPRRRARFSPIESYTRLAAPGTRAQL